MTPARRHAEWLSLVESSGPFLSMPVLLRVFPQGLEPRDPNKASRLREAYEDWLERGAKQPAVHHAWIRHVLTELLEYPPQFLVEGQGIPPGMEAVMANYGETLRPEFVLKHRGGDKPVLLIEHYAPDQDLEKPVAGKMWKASPGTRMMELLHAADVPLGLVTNGEQWMIVYAPRGETTGFASWYADLWMQEPITLRAFHSLLHLRRFLGVAEPDTLAALYAESAKDQQEVTDQLGYQVRRAVEMLVQAFDRIDAESERKLLAGVSEKDLYNGALTVMMRLVFLFSADERGLLLLGDPLYDQHYAVSTLSEILRERADQQGEEVLERRHDAWCRLLATFRAVHSGVEHEAMRLPPYGGTLFDPDRYPFLEGRAIDTRWQTTPAKPLPINNRVVLHLLEALQLLRVKVPGNRAGSGQFEARRLSFRALDIEQIGHVYEGLLDHTAKRANEVVLGLAGAKNSEPEIPLSKLEELAAKGPDTLVEFLTEETGRSDKALRKALDAANGGSAQAPPSPPAAGGAVPSRGSARGGAAQVAVRKDLNHQLLIACGHDPLLARRVSPFAALLREDDFGQLVVIPEGSVYVTVGSDRRSTGTHYTPRSLTEPIVKHTLEPLVYTGPAEGKPQAEWKLKPPREILALKVCDMTMGSGAFLVQTCRYLAERLVEAWEIAEKANPGKILASPEGDFSAGDPKERIIPTDAAERLAIARRYVADRCLYGVDINPMAVEMAKLSLWLITLQRDRPFTFLDHALKCGDSLLGVSSVKQVENFTLRAKEGEYVEHTFATANLFRYVEAASAKRRALEDLPSNDHAQIETKIRLHAEAETATAKVKALADCLIALELRGLDGEEYDANRDAASANAQRAMERPVEEFQEYAIEQLRGRHPFHWPVEFPEVFARGGFDAFVGNPPFQGGTVASTVLGTDYTGFIKRMNEPWHGKADLVGAFFRHARRLLGNNRCFGFLATASLCRGETADSALRPLMQNGGCIFRSRTPFPWPGSASVTAVCAWIVAGPWKGEMFVDDLLVEAIGIDLEEDTSGGLSPMKLPGSFASFLGVKLAPDNQPLALLAIQALPEDVRAALLPAIGGDELGGLPDPMQAPRSFEVSMLTDEQIANCAGILGKAISRESLEHSAPAKELRELMRQFPLLVACNETTHRHLAFTALPTRGLLLKHTAIGIPASRWSLFAVVQSAFHETWAWKFGIRRKEDLRYLPKRCGDTFPLPEGISAKAKATTSPLDTIGENYHSLRREILAARVEGLTALYNRFHDPGEQSADIARLRTVHVEMDQSVAAAYDWSDLDLGHGFHATKQGERYTISEPARRIILDRLLALNHQRYAEEVQAGVHDKAAKKAASKRKRSDASAPQGELIKPPQQEFF